MTVLQGLEMLCSLQELLTENHAARSSSFALHVSLAEQAEGKHKPTPTGYEVHKESKAQRPGGMAQPFTQMIGPQTVPLLSACVSNRGVILWDSLGTGLGVQAWRMLLQWGLRSPRIRTLL